MASVQSLDVISNYVDKLEAADQTTALCEIYAKVNKREIDNQTMVDFFSEKGLDRAQEGCAQAVSSWLAKGAEGLVGWGTKEIVLESRLTGWIDNTDPSLLLIRLGVQ
eukprot:CAMPEP_0172017538 /NCGR_PEP_ID=MMETSP1041-20130122/11617_1 /TAXON_ID=464988 /ORGANISM="Hemiselmis andersenii, Strain CCMP439" /LENGTH=107 /DNA_ID=CAMNT_0012672573 /DNA_START=42 /DNA_END=365 /DNA_ORIENTATION=+